MEHITLKRKNPYYVKIAHISDLHFGESTRFPFVTSSCDLSLIKLARDICMEEPDILCVTGDIADRTIAEAIKLKGGNFLSVFNNNNGRSYNDFLRELWQNANRFFNETICIPAKINSTALFVVPGNHDYRLQGFLGNDENAVNLFQECFIDAFKSRSLLFTNEGYESIKVDFICLDSNLDSNEEDLATGCIPEKEMAKFLEFQSDARQIVQSTGKTAFRVCLLHHHPLPVIPAENYQELGNGSKVVERLLRTPKSFTGPQTTLLRNAGAFLCAAISSKVDVIFHGHDHQPWVSEIRYPRANEFHRLIVAAAGKAGTGSDDRYTYNTAKLYLNTNIQVTHRTIERNLSQYEDSPPFPRYTDSQIREIRRNKTCLMLKGEIIEPSRSDEGIRYGMMQAFKCASLTTITSYGSAIVTNSFDGLEPTSDKPVSILPIVSYTPGYIGIGKKILINVISRYNGTNYRINAEFKSARDSGEVDICLTFNPALRKGHPVSFEVIYTVHNAFDFVEEQRRSRTKNRKHLNFTPQGWESVSTSPRIIFSEQLSETVIFPSSFNFSGTPKVHVYDDAGRTDAEEQDYCSRWFQYIESSGIVSLNINLPLPSLMYEIAWPLVTRDAYENLYYPQSLIRVKHIASLSRNSNLDQHLTDMLVALRCNYSKRLGKQHEFPLMDTYTELSLFVVHHELTGPINGEQALDVTLELFAHAQVPESVTQVPLSFGEGVGLVGQAFRNENVVFDYSTGRSGLYKMLEGQTKAHEFISAIPLRAITSEVKATAKSTSDLKYAPFAVLCVGTYKKCSQLEQQLRGLGEFEVITRDSFIDHIQGQFSSEVIDYLKSLSI